MTNLSNDPFDGVDIIMAELAQAAQQLAADLDYWGGGSYDPTRPRQRELAGKCVDTIDAMLRTLHQRRAELVTEIRQYDEESLRRSDELLARIRAERGEGRS